MVGCCGWVGGSTITVQGQGRLGEAGSVWVIYFAGQTGLRSQAGTLHTCHLTDLQARMLNMGRPLLYPPRGRSVILAYHGQCYARLVGALFVGRKSHG